MQSIRKLKSLLFLVLKITKIFQELDNIHDHLQRHFLKKRL